MTQAGEDVRIQHLYADMLRANRPAVSALLVFAGKRRYTREYDFLTRLRLQPQPTWLRRALFT